jgi:hypothetical protein
MIKDPLFLRFINRETPVIEMLSSFSRSGDKSTREAAGKALENPPDLEEFRTELTEAVTDIVKEGAGEEFKVFVNHYMDSLVEDVDSRPSQLGENITRMARIKDVDGPWIQGFICYNLCLYLKAFGTECLKKCKVCGKIFAHKGAYAIYCSDPCKAKGKKMFGAKEKDPKNPGLALPSLPTIS